jgi:hypothetical protein
MSFVILNVTVSPSSDPTGTALTLLQFVVGTPTADSRKKLLDALGQVKSNSGPDTVAWS